MPEFDFSDAVNPFEGNNDFDFSDAVNPFEPKRPDRTLLGTAKDIGITALKGAINLPQAFVGLGDIATGGRVGKYLEEAGYRPEDAKQLLDEGLSPAQQYANQQVDNAQGFSGTLEALKDNPSAVATTVGESLPQMLGGAGIARGLLTAAPRMAPLVAGAVGEGAVAAGSSAEQIRNKTEDGLLTPEQQLAATASGVGTAGLGVLGGRFAQKLGIGDMDTALAGGLADTRRNFFARPAGQGITEGIFEEMPQSAQEQMWQNFALGKPLDEGVSEAAATGLAAGSLTGAGFEAGRTALGGFENRTQPSAVEDQLLNEGNDQAANAQPQALGYSPQRMIAMPDGTTAWEGDLQQQRQQLGETPPAARNHPGFSELHKTADQIEAELGSGLDIDSEIAALENDLNLIQYRPTPIRNMEGRGQTITIDATGKRVKTTLQDDPVQPFATNGSEIDYTPEGAIANQSTPGLSLADQNGIDYQQNADYQDPAKINQLSGSIENQMADYAKSQRLSVLPQGFDDERLARDEYRNILEGLGNQLTPGGDISYTRDGQDRITGRTSSVNPDWFKNLPPEEKLSVVDTQDAIKKALAGQKLGVRQTRLVKRLLDEASGVRSNQAEHLKAQRQETKRARLEALKSFWDEMPDTGNDPFGIHQENVAELFNEDNYEPEATYDDRSIAEMASQAEAMGADWRDVDKALDSGDSAQTIQALSQLIYGLRNEHRPTRTATNSAAPGAAQAGDVQPGRGEAPVESMAGESADVAQPAKTGRAGEVAPAVKESLTVSNLENAAPVSSETEPTSYESKDIDAIANEAATSPNNDLPEPTQAQKEAGNYKKGHLSLHGLDIAIENPSGSTRRGVDKNGKAWESTMHGHYGYVKRTQGADGDQVDVFIGNKPDSDKVFVIDQYNADGTFDEHKVVMGTSSMLEAKSLYKRNYQKGWKVGPATAMNVDEFKAWLKDGDTTKPLAADKESAKPRQESSASIPPQTNNGAASSDNLVRGEKSANKETGKAPWWETDNKYSSVYLIGKSRGRDSVTIERMGLAVIIRISNSGVGGEFIGSIPSGIKFLKLRLAGLGDAMAGTEMTVEKLRAKLNLVKGEDIFDIELDEDGKSILPSKSTGKPETMADSLKSMTDSDLDDLLDDIFAESPESTVDTSKPRAKRPKKTGDGKKLRKTATKPEVTNTDDSQAVKRTAGEIAKSMGGNLGSAAVNALEGLTKLFGGANNLNMGVSFDEQTYAKAKPHFEAVWKDFQAAGRDLADFVRAVRDNFGAGVKPYLARWSKEKAAELRGNIEPSEKSLASHLLEHIADIKSNLGLKISLGEFYGVKPKDISPEQLKEGQEAFEVALVNRSREIVESGVGDRAIFSDLLKLYSAQPNLNVRSSTSIENQAYSTPAPLAYVAGRLAGITRSKRVYEPTAGNGMLLITAAVENVAANELNPERAANLRSLGFSVTQEDGSEYIPAGAMDSAIMNPPFGPLERFGKPSTVDYDGYGFKKIDHLIVAKALEAVKNGGRASIIIAANREPGVIGNGSDKVFFNWLYSHYNVIDHFEVDGDLYSRQGASWPVRVITINGREASSNFAPESGSIKRFDLWEDIYDHVEQVLGSDGYRAERHSENSSKPAGRTEEPSGNKTADGVKTTNADGASGTGRGRGGARSAGAGRQLQQPDLWNGGSSSDSVDAGARRHSAKHDVANAEPKTKADGSRGPGSSATSGKADVLPSNGSGVNPSKPVVTGGASEFQAEYIAASAGFNDSVLTPKNMAEATQRALRNIENEVGDIDEYVAKKLGYPSVQVAHKGLMALQVDTVAAAIYNIEARDRAIIIADQTGVGKGRQAASMIRYAVRNGKTPVFITVKPNLFSDMYGDLVDIGSGNIRPFITNDDVGVEYNGETLFVSKGKSHRDKLRAIVDSGGLPPNHHALFTTYDQLRGEDNIRRNAISALKNPLFILDESHNAAGERQKEGKFGGKKTAVNTTAGFIFDALAGHPVVYLSATYAKRPDNMPLYYRTDLMDAVDSPDELIDAVNSGGVPLQQVVAYMLASNGQLFRRERSFAGIKMNFIKDTSNVAEQERISDSVNRGLRSIVTANRLFVEWFKENGKSIAPPGGSSMLAGNKADAMAGSVNPFTSVVHNYIRQLLLGIKVKAAAEQAIALHRVGKKPVIALENTMGSFLAEYVEKNKLKVGDPVRFTYNDILKTALERSRRVSFKDDKGKSAPVTVGLDELDFITRSVYTDAEAEINNIDLSSLPASPIDYMLNEFKKAGIQVAEITGRDYFVDYSGSVPVLGQRSAKVINSRRKVVDDFNSGNLDALILNAAGSTGLSIHASERFRDQSPRHMIVVQPMLDINVLMQMLGRINRTGQVELPEFTFLSLDLPSEIRPTATTKGKMAKLNANTSANDKSDTSFEAPDFMNKYGDQVVNEYLLDNPQIASETGVSATEENPMPDLALRFTGRLALLDAKKQRQAMDEILALYAAKIDYLNSVGMNDLVSQDLPLDAYILESKIVHEGKDPNSVFAGHTTLHKVNAKYIGKPPTASEVAAALKKSLQGRAPSEITNAIIAEKDADNGFMDDLYKHLKKQQDEAAKKLAALDAYKNKNDADQEKLAKLAEAHTLAELRIEGVKESINSANAARQEFIGALRGWLEIGDRMLINTGDEEVFAVVVDIKNTHKKGSGNPWAESKLKITLMLNSGARQITVNYRQLKKGLLVEPMSGSGTDGLEEIFNPNIAEDRREIRYIATGNLIAGAAKLRGKIANFTDRAGIVHQGILLPRSYDKTGEFEGGETVSNFVARDPDAIAKFLQGKGADVGVRSPDNAVKVSASRDNTLTIYLPQSNKNKTVFSIKLDRQLRDIVGDFFSQGGAHVAKIPQGKVRDAIRRLIELTPLSIPSSLRKEWVEAGGGAAPEAVMSFDGKNFQSGEAPTGELSEVRSPAPKQEAKPIESRLDETASNGRRFGSKFITDAPVKIYTTKKGKVLEGVIAKGIGLEDVKRHVDPYAMKMDGGVFIRMAHVQRPEEPKFSLSDTSAESISQNEVQAIIDRVSASFGAKLKVTPVASAVELPPEVQAHMEKNGIAGNKVKGVFHKGAIFVNREALQTAQDVETVILHELAHVGLAKMFGADIQAAMGSLYLAMGGDKTLRELATKYAMPLEKYQAAYASAKPAERLGFMTEELLAHIAENNKPSVKRFLKELIGAIRSWLRSKGFLSSAELSESELFALLKEVRQFAAVDDGGIRYSLSNESTRPSGGFSLSGVKKVVTDAFKSEQRLAADRARENLPGEIRDSLDRLGDPRTVRARVRDAARRWLTPSGLLTKEVHKLKLERDGQLNGDEFHASIRLQGFYDAVKEGYQKEYEYLQPATKARLNQAMRGEDVRIPEQVKTAIAHMRDQIKRLSAVHMEQLLDDAAALEQQGDEAGAAAKLRLADTIASNFETYLHRSYRAFDDPDWPNKVRKSYPEVYAAAVNYLANGYAKSDQVKKYKSDRKQARKKATSAEKRHQFEQRYYSNHAEIQQARKHFNDLKRELSEAKNNYSLADLANNKKDKNKYEAEIDKLVLRVREANKNLTKIKNAAAEAAIESFRDSLASVTPSRENLDLAKKKVALMLEEGTAFDSLGAFISESKLGAKDLSIIKRRKTIAPEILALLGEYEDAPINYTKSVAKMSRLVYNHAFLKKLREHGFEAGLFSESANTNLGHNKKIAGDASETYAPLNGLYTTHEFHQALVDAMGKETEMWWYRQLVSINGMVKFGKTVLSPTTALRNLYSAMFFSLTNGHFDFSKGKNFSWSTYFAGKPDALAYMEKLRRLGVVYDNPYAGEMMALLKDSRLDETVFNWKPFKWTKTGIDYAQKFYGFGDDLWKIIGFENEKAMLMKHKGMSEAAAEVEAAERIRNTYPTYSLIPKAVNALRRFPLVGTFVSFPAEIIRTSYHIVRYFGNDIRELGLKNPMVQRKAVGLLIAGASMYALQAITKALVGVDDDEEKALRLMSPEWQKNSNLAYLGRDDKGALQTMDMSFLDPYGYWKRPINALLQDQPLWDAIKSGAKDVLSPFFGQDITFGAIMDVAVNQKDTGGRVFNPQDTVVNQTLDISAHMAKAVQPGIVSNITRMYMAATGKVTASGKKFDVEDELAALAGFRWGTFDPKTSMYYQTFAFTDAKADASKILTAAIRDPNRLDEEELRDAFDTAMRARAKAYDRMAAVVSAAEKSGLSKWQINKTLRDSGISNEDARALISGATPKWKLEQSAMRSNVRRAGVLFSQEVADEIKRRQRIVRDWSK